MLALGAVAWAASQQKSTGDGDLPSLVGVTTVKAPQATPTRDIIPTEELKAAPTATAHRMGPRRAISSIDDLVGKYVMTYSSLSSSLGDGGGTVSITRGMGDSIVLNNFWGEGVALKAAVNLSQKTITIPGQYAITNSNYGACDFAPINTSSGSPERSSSITATFDDSGNITLSGWWGIFINSGTYADYFLYAGYNTLIEPANGNMHVSVNDTTLTYDWAVILEQTGKNLVTVKNFGNHGKTLEIVLNSDGTLTINSQVAWSAGDNQGDFYTYAANWETGKTTSGTISGLARTQELTWGNWVMYSSKNYITGKFADATITGIEFSIPVNTVTSLDGSGTQADPFRIRTLDDLIYLADTVNANEDKSFGGPYIYYSRTFADKYFVIENDIDMSNYRFTPIGDDYYHRFAGVIDGQNHTLTGLNVNTGSNGCAGLFGFLDSTSVIKNVNLKNVEVRTAGYYCGAMTATSYGSIENCTVTGTVYNTMNTTGGIAAITRNMSDCSFNGTVTGLGGACGGVAGEITGTMQRCSAVGTLTVGGAATGVPSGGVAGSVYGDNAKCINCYFSGVLNGGNYKNLALGGIAGQNVRGVIDGCFTAATIYGLYGNAMVGGIVGNLGGTVQNSYATGFIQCTSSRTTGGIVGNVSYYVLSTGDTLQSTVKNCYYAGCLRAETFNYDPDTEVRETLGKIAAGANPTIENVYFDNQMTDMRSTHYGVRSAVLTSASGPGFSSDVWTYTEGYYPRITAIADNDAAKLSATALDYNTAVPDKTEYIANNTAIKTLGNTKAYLLNNGTVGSTGHCGSITNGTFTLNGQYGNDTILLANTAMGNVIPVLIPIKVAPKMFDGEGTESNPFQIKTKADVITLGKMTSEKDQFFTNVYFQQMNDIDMEKDTTFKGLATHLTSQSNYRFAGIYDGAGHTLKNLKIYIMGWTTEPTATSIGTPNTDDDRTSIYKGFVGRLDPTGVVKNLTIDENSECDLWAQAGMFVGYCYGTVENCRNYGTLRCYSGTGGGIVGSLQGTGVVRNCLNAGHIYGGWNYYGGIVGTASGTIENCMNVGTVEIKQLSTFQSKAASLKTVGGIAGQAVGAMLKNLVNAGHVVALGGNAGGLFGNYTSTSKDAGYNDTYNCIDYGTVFSGDATTTGAIGGSGYPTKATIENVYYDKQVTGLKAAANSSVPSITAVETSELTSGTPLTGFSTDIWQFTAGQYPILKNFADLPVVQSAAKTIVNVVSGQTVKSLSDDATLSSAQWTLEDGTKFSVDGTTLKVPTVDTEIVSDTLNVTNGTFTTRYALTAIPKNPLAGSGTLEDPFQIVDPYTWDAFAHYMADTQNSFADQYVKVMNDINFADTTFVPFGYDGITGFDGHLLGNNVTVSNISYTATAKYQGAICKLGASGTVQDLTLQGKITTAQTYTGGFFGEMNGIATNCVNNIAIEATANYAGGFAGLANGTAKFVNCENKAEITSTKGYVAGFVASAKSGIKFIECINSGNVTNTGATSTKYTGGFIAYGAGACLYYRCVNTGTITSEKGTIAAGLTAYAAGSDTIKFLHCHNSGLIKGASSIGGLFGATGTSGNSVMALYAIDCYNDGEIHSLLKASQGVGGLFGALSKGSYIDSCYNVGTVTTDVGNYAGGVWGHYVNATSEETRIHVTNCYNTAPISCGGNYASGLGTVPGYATIENCYNTGDVKAVTAAAGVGNIMGHEAYINNCWNSGNVETSKNAAGGITGMGIYRSYVTNCFNTGDVKAGTESAGGLGGATRSHYTNCYNRGNVSGPKAVGGLLGLCYNTTSANYTANEFHNCYNAGIVTSDDVALGGNIVGNTTAWNTDKGNLVENTYYEIDYRGMAFAADTIGGTLTTVKELAASEDLPGNWSYGDEYTYPIIKGMEENLCAKTFAVAVVLIEPDTYDNVTGRFYMGEQDNVTWTSSTDSIYINDYAFIGGPVDKMYTPVTMTAVSDDGQFQAPWYIQMNAETGLDEKQLTDRQLIGSRYYNITGAAVSEPQKGNIYIRIDEYNDGSQSAVKVRF